MTEGADAADQVVRMMLSGGEISIRLTGSALKNGLAMLLALIKNHKKVFGKINMVRMLRDTRDIRSFTMTPQQFKAFQALARKFKLLYAAVQNGYGRNALVDVVLPSTEIARANMVFDKIKFAPVQEEQKPIEQEEPAPKKERRSGPDSRDTRVNSSTRAEKEKTMNDRPSVEQQLKGYKAEGERQSRQVLTKTKAKYKTKGKAK